jgi:hypothetical protein
MCLKEKKNAENLYEMAAYTSFRTRTDYYPAVLQSKSVNPRKFINMQAIFNSFELYFKNKFPTDSFNALHLPLKDQQFSAVWGNNRCLSTV